MAISAPMNVQTQAAAAGAPGGGGRKPPGGGRGGKRGPKGHYADAKRRLCKGCNKKHKGECNIKCFKCKQTGHAVKFCSDFHKSIATFTQPVSRSFVDKLNHSGLYFPNIVEDVGPHAAPMQQPASPPQSASQQDRRQEEGLEGLALESLEDALPEAQAEAENLRSSDVEEWRADLPDHHKSQSSKSEKGS